MPSVYDTLKLYKFANKQRDEFYNIKWRLFVIALIIIGMWFANNYLQTNYPTSPQRLVVSATSNTALQASERMFNWFVTGFLVGFLAFALMFEGEFFIATRKIAKLIKFESSLGSSKQSKIHSATKKKKRK